MTGDMTDSLIEIARKAGEEILHHYRNGGHSDSDIEWKDDNSPLTKADLAAHHVIVDALRELTPEIPIISEEGGIAEYEERSGWERFWLVDPLDGTKEFIKRNGEFTVNIALIEDSRPVFGVVHIPDQGTTYFGDKDRGAFRIDSDGSRHRIYSRYADRDMPLTVVSSRSHGSDDLEEKLAGHGVTIGKKIPAGSSLKFCLVAEGKADLYPRLGPTMEWDTAAGDAVFRYSGKDGPRLSPLTYNKKDLRNGHFIIGL